VKKRWQSLVSKISQKEYNDFKSLFLNVPALALLHISNNCHLVDECLEYVRAKNEGTIVSKDLQNIDCNRFRLKSREYEFIILSDVFSECDNKEKFLKSCYHSLENGAFIIIIEQKNKNKEQEILELLDSVEFRVANPISIFEDYTLVMAKKLHMWGNGL